MGLKESRRDSPISTFAAAKDSWKQTGGGIEQVVKGAGKVSGVRYGFWRDDVLNSERRFILFSKRHERNLLPMS